MSNNFQVDFGSINSARITILVDNRTDSLLQSTEIVKYYTKKVLLAEHGFSLLIEINDEQRILMDTGTGSETLQKNMFEMGFTPSSINTVVISHGHSDHTGSMPVILKAITQTNNINNRDGLSVFIHPSAFQERWRIYNDNNEFESRPVPNEKEWENLGVQIVYTRSPYRVYPGCWLTGFIPRESFETQAAPVYKTVIRDKDKLIDDIVEDEQAFILNVSGKGLIVLSGCAHAGIINTINYARWISGVDRIYAVIGGFHLAFSNQDEVEKTLSALKEIEYIVPLHCTGFAAQAEIYRLYPKKYLHGVVGATFIF